MWKNKGEQPILKASLPPLQKTILLALAHEGPQTKNQVKKHVKKDYHAVSDSFSALIKKKMVEKAGKTEYKGRKFDLFWLTPHGIIYALTYNANHELTKQNALNTTKSDDEKRAINFFFDFTFAVGPERFLEIIEIVDAGKEGKLTIKNLVLKSMPLRDVQFDRVAQVLLKYPEVKKGAVKAFKQISKMLEENGKIEDIEQKTEG
jgi:hypothetical protein